MSDDNMTEDTKEYDTYSLIDYTAPGSAVINEKELNRMFVLRSNLQKAWDKLIYAPYSWNPTTLDEANSQAEMIKKKTLQLLREFEKEMGLRHECD